MSFFANFKKEGMTMKKNLIIFLTLLAFVSFGIVSNAQAFIDPVSLTVILGITMATIVVTAEKNHDEKDEQLVLVKQQKESKETVQTQNQGFVSK